MASKYQATALAPATRSWTRSEVWQLIEFYESERCLYDIGSKNYHNRMLRKKALQNIAAQFENCSEQDVTKKWHNLTTQYRKEKNKEKSVNAGDDTVPSKWQYLHALSFLDSCSPDCRTSNQDESTGSAIEDNGTPAQDGCIKIEELDPLEMVSTEISSPNSDVDPQPSTANIPPSTFQKEVGRPTGLWRERKRKKTVEVENVLLHEAVGLMWSIAERKNKKEPTADDCAAFGNFVASELRLIENQIKKQEMKSKICAVIFNKD